jgi:ClpP class serine protease
MRYSRILSRLCNQPLAFDDFKFNVIHDNIVLRLLSGAQLDSGVAQPTQKQIELSDYPIINVFDSLVGKNGGGESGATSYQSIVNQSISYVNAGHKKIGFYIDTPGGEYSGMTGASNFLASLPSQYGVETFGVSDGIIHSAGYGLASALQKIYITPDTSVGSIAVIGTLIDTTKLDSKEGIKYEIIRSKSEKALGNPHEPITSELLTRFKKQIDIFDGMFNNLASKNRPVLGISDIIDLKGKTVIGQEAIDLKLADFIVPSAQEAFLIEFSKSGNLNRSTKSNSIFISKSGNFTMTLEEALQKIGALEVEKLTMANELNTLKASTQQLVDAAVKQATTSEAARAKAIFESAEAMKIDSQKAVKYVVEGKSAEFATEIFQTMAEISAQSTANIQGNTSGINGAQGQQTSSHTLASGYSIDSLLSALAPKA